MADETYLNDLLAQQTEPVARSLVEEFAKMIRDPLAHHQTAGYVVPVTTNITPHINRLRSMMQKYKLLA